MYLLCNRKWLLKAFYATIQLEKNTFRKAMSLSASVLWFCGLFSGHRWESISSDGQCRYSVGHSSSSWGFCRRQTFRSRAVGEVLPRQWTSAWSQTCSTQLSEEGTHELGCTTLSNISLCCVCDVCDVC